MKETPEILSLPPGRYTPGKPEHNTLMRSVAHYLRTPLTPVALLPDLLESASQEEMPRLLQMLRTAVEEQVQAIDNMVKLISVSELNLPEELQEESVAQEPCPCAPDDKLIRDLIEAELSLRDRLNDCICGKSREQLLRYVKAVAASRAKLCRTAKCDRAAAQPLNS